MSTHRLSHQITLTHTVEHSDGLVSTRIYYIPIYDASDHTGTSIRSIDDVHAMCIHTMWELGYHKTMAFAYEKKNFHWHAQLECIDD